MDEVKYLNIKSIEQVEIPEGLEERLSMKIDQWADMEKEGLRKGTAETKSLKRGILTWTKFYKSVTIAACISAVIGIGSIIGLHTSRNKAQIDTFCDPKLAQAVANKALWLLAYNLEKGMTNYEKAREITTKTQDIIDNTLNDIK